jgi:hypothetical protein
LFIIVCGKRIAEDSGVQSPLQPSSNGGVLSILHSFAPRYTLYHSKGDWIVGLTFSLSVITGIYCLSYLTVPTFAAVKKSGMLFSWLIELSNPTATTVACLPSLITVALGSVCQAWYDLEFSVPGVVHGLLSCFFQSASFEIGKRMITHGKDLWSVLLINSLVFLGVQILYMSMYSEGYLIEALVGAVVLGDEGALQIITNKKDLWSSHHQHVHHDHAVAAAVVARATRSQVGFNVLFNCTLVLLMNFSIFLNCSVNSPLAHVVTGNVKAIFTTICAIVLFDLTLHRMGYLGIAVGAAGGAWFSWIKYAAEVKRKAAVAAATTTATTTATSAV